MLDVHPAHHAASTWRDFFIHIATVVIGLCIAVGLEQGVEAIHHHEQLKQTREALRFEREENHRHFAEETGFWRESIARIENNLLVLRFLQQHPGTPQEKLPGVLAWSQNTSPFTYAAWEGAQETGAASLMPRAEVSDDTLLYKKLHMVSERSGDVWLAVNNAEEYNLTDYNPSHLSPARLAEVIALTEKIQTEQYRHGVELQNVASTYPDFPPSVTLTDLHRLRHYPEGPAHDLLLPARTVTIDRLDAQRRFSPQQ